MGWHQILGLLCFLFFLHSFLPFASSLCPPDQRDALLLFKNSSELDSMALDSCDLDQSYPKTNSWSKSVDCCSWDGVTCDGVTGNVIGLDLTCSWLRGTLHSNSSLFLLRHLRSLDLHGNNFSRGLEFEVFTKLKNLRRLIVSQELNLTYNRQNYTFLKLEVLGLPSCNLTKFPSFLNSLNRLTNLDLSSNRISGKIPRWFWGISRDTLGLLDLSKNLLEGGIQQLHWKRLSVLYLQNNLFQGSLPILPPSIFEFHASYNGFNGEIPSSICQLRSLRYLYLSNNNLSGNSPPCFGNITNLEFLDLSRNKFQGQLLTPPPLTSIFLAFDNGFTGEIPSSICQLSLVKYLDLSNNNLSGNMPQCFGNMTSLFYLSLSSNKLQGPLPRPLVKCVDLSTLVLSYNEFSDIFPHWLEVPHLAYLNLQSNKFHGKINLTAFEHSFRVLTSLSISNNNFTGQWPKKVFSNTSLLLINLSDNKFGGPIPLPSPVTFYYSIASNNISGTIPSLICNATNLEIIDLSDNGLTGSLPPCLTNFSTNMSVLKLRTNHLEGIIPQSFSWRNSLKTLDLSQNWFEGTLPRSLVKCKYLEVVDLSDNLIEDMFPSWLGTLPELKVLVLRSNNFKDLLNISIGAPLFTKLHILDLSNNNFGGPLPANLIMNLKAMMNGENGQDKSLYMIPYLAERNIQSKSYENSVTVTMKGQEIELVKILTFLTIIDLSHNSFEGNIPKVIGHLHSLIGLNLSHNHLTGSIPSTLGNLTNLGWLDLSSNRLRGVIPRKLGDLASLGYLNLSKNQLTGRIPQDKQLSTFSSDSFGGNPSLCGTPLLKACPDDAQPPLPSFNQKGHESWIKQKEVWIGYASGIVIGISIAYITFETRRPKWLARGVRMLERRAVEWMEKPKRKAIKFHGQ